MVEGSESAFLQCETCGQGQRVWLNQCKKCMDPLDNWYEKEIAKLHKKIEDQNQIIKKQIDLLHSLEGKLRNE